MNTSQWQVEYYVTRQPVTSGSAAAGSVSILPLAIHLVRL